MGEQGPGLYEIATQWRFDPFWTLVLVAAGACYVRAARRLRAREPRRAHPRWKSASFLAGLALVGLAVLSPLEHYGNALLWVNFLDLLVLTMAGAPLVLAGSPLTLAFRVASPAGRARLRACYRSFPARWATNPAVAWLAFAVVTYLWQFSGLTGAAVRNPLVRDLQLTTLLVVSLCFWTPALAADPLRWRLPYPLRALYVFLEMTHKGFFGGMFLSMNHPLHPDFTAAWGPDPMLDQRLAIAILWVGGSLVFLAVLLGIIARWIAYENRHEVRVDRRLALERAAAGSHRAALERVFQKPV
jgi:putative copper resistance protein D